MPVDDPVKLGDELLLCRAELLREILGVGLEQAEIEGLRELVAEVELESVDDGEPEALRVAVVVSEGVGVVLREMRALFETERVTAEQALDDLLIVPLLVALRDTVVHTETVGDLDKLGEVE